MFKAKEWNNTTLRSYSTRMRYSNSAARIWDVFEREAPRIWEHGWKTERRPGVPASASVACTLVSSVPGSVFSNTVMVCGSAENSGALSFTSSNVSTTCA